MEDIDKTIVIVAAFIAVVILAFIGHFTYREHLRAEIVGGSPDMLAAACAFDSGGQILPPSCVAYLFPNQQESIQ